MQWENIWEDATLIQSFCNDCKRNIEKILDDLIVRSIIPLKEKLDADISYD